MSIPQSVDFRRMVNRTCRIVALLASIASALPVFDVAAKGREHQTGAATGGSKSSVGSSVGFSTDERFSLYAMRPPEEYRAARAAASHWLQLRISGMEASKTAGVCLVRGEVTRTFRGPPPAAKAIELEVECKKRGERSPPGDEFRVDMEDLVPGRYLEAFAEVRGVRYAVVARQVELIAKPGAKPTFTGKE